MLIGPQIYMIGVSWWSRKQTVVARNICEADFWSLAQATADILWLQSLLSELNIATATRSMFCDNLSVVFLAHNPIQHSLDKIYGA